MKKLKIILVIYRKFNYLYQNDINNRLYNFGQVGNKLTRFVDINLYFLDSQSLNILLLHLCYQSSVISTLFPDLINGLSNLIHEQSVPTVPLGH